METIELKANIRKAVGNSPARGLRRQKQIPAVLYGPKTEPILLSIESADLEHILSKGNIGQAILKLVIDNGATINKTTMIKELQTHPLSRAPLHVDFYEISMDQKIKVNVPIITTGISKGVELGGVLQIVRRELEVSCLPQEIPEAFEIDVTDLDIGDSVHVEEIPLAGNIEIIHDVDFTVLTVLSPTAAEEPEAEEIEEGEEAEAEAGEEAEPDTE